MRWTETRAALGAPLQRLRRERAGSEGRLLHAFACLVAASTFFLIIAGGLVTSTGSGLAVPDWPLSYGMLMPPMVGGIFYEHGHRMVAGTVAILTFILMVWLARREPRRWVRSIGYIAFGAVILQAVLGGLTVIFLLPTPISVAHATLAQTFFCLTVVLALVTSPRWPRASSATSGFTDPPPRTEAGSATSPLIDGTAGEAPRLEAGAAGVVSSLTTGSDRAIPHREALAVGDSQPHTTPTDRWAPELDARASTVVPPRISEKDRKSPNLETIGPDRDPASGNRRVHEAPPTQSAAGGEARHLDAGSSDGEPRRRPQTLAHLPAAGQEPAAPRSHAPVVNRQPRIDGGAPRRLAACVFAAIYLQLLLGALVRHTGSALAIPDFPLAFGGLVPDHWSPQIAIHFAHRLGAIVVTILVVALLWRVARWRPRPSGLIGPAAAIGILLPVQIALGAAIVLTGRQVFPGTAHVAVGALLLAASLVLAIRAYLPAWTSAAAGPRAAGTAHALRARPA